MTRIRAIVLDVDGTLLDSVYHHTVTWGRAFAACGVDVPSWRIHRSVGMGGDKLVAHAAGEEVERRVGDQVRERWEKEYDAVLGETTLLPGALGLLVRARRAGLQVALASSGIPKHAQHAADLLDADRHADVVTTAEDAEESKPESDLVETVLDELGTAAACMVGDAVWDVHAATRAGIPTIGLRTGGYDREELISAGAVAVYDDPDDLAADLDAALEACARWLENTAL